MARFRLPSNDPLAGLFGLASLAQNQQRLGIAEEEAKGASALRELQRRRLQQEMNDESMLGTDVASLLAASKGGTLHTVGGTTIAQPQDVSDLAGQNLIAMRELPRAETLPDLAGRVDAGSLARVMKHRPQVLSGLGLQSPAATEKATQQKAARQKIAGILRETPKTAEEHQQWWDRITGAWLEGGLEKADDILEARMKLKSEDPTMVAQATSTFLTSLQAHQQAGHQGIAALAAAASDAATAHPTAGKIIQDLVTKFKPAEAKETKPVSVAPGHQLVDPESGTVRYTAPPAPGKTEEQIAGEEAAKTRGRLEGLPRDVREIELRARKAIAEHREAMAKVHRGETPRTLKEITSDIKQFEGILKGIPTGMDLYGMSPEEKADAQGRRQEVEDILRELYQERTSARQGQPRPLPGRESTAAIPSQRPERPAPTERAAAQAELTDMTRTQYAAVVTRLYPGKTWQQLSTAEKQRVVDAINRGS